MNLETATLRDVNKVLPSVGGIQSGTFRTANFAKVHVGDVSPDEALDCSFVNIRVNDQCFNAAELRDIAKTLLVLAERLDNHG